MANISTNHPDIVVTLAAGEVLRIPRRGRAYHCISITNDDGSVKVGMGYEPKESLRVGMGQVLHSAAPDFEYLKFDNTSAGAQTIVVATSDGTIVDNRFTLVGGVVPVAVVTPDLLDAPADISIPNTSTATLVKAATANQLELIIQNKGAASIYVGGPSVSNVRGLLLAANSVLVLNTSAAVYAWNNSGAAVPVGLVATVRT